MRSALALLADESAFAANDNFVRSVSGAAHTYDLRGNLRNSGARAYCYDLENRLTGVAGAGSVNCATPIMTLSYDPLGRLRQTTAAGATTDFLYDGDRLVAEYNGAGAMLRRYVHGPGVDEPLAWYEGSNLTDRRYLIANHQGSVIAEEGSATTRYAYGPYGEPDSWTGSRFRYTGQIALPEVGLYHYRARAYDPVLGRFLQTDPVMYDDSFNLYSYAANDPLNKSDPTGEWVWVAAGAALSGGIQAVAEINRGSFREGVTSRQGLQGLGRIAISAIGGAFGGGAARAASGVLAGEGVRAAGARILANAAIGGVVGQHSAGANANLVEGRQPTMQEMRQGQIDTARAAALGSALGEVVPPAVALLPGAASAEARHSAAFAERLVQGQNMPGNSGAGAGIRYNLGGNPGGWAGVSPGAVGAVLGQGADTAVSAAGQRPIQPTCTDSRSGGC